MHLPPDHPLRIEHNDEAHARPSEALQAVPADWLAGLPGEVMAATHAALLTADADAPDYEALATRHFGGNVLVGAGIAAGAGIALTDFHIRDGFSRLLVLDRGMTPRQAGRMMQRLLEIDTCRLMALLALPVAHGLTPWLNDAERELAQISAALVESNEATEPVLLERLTRKVFGWPVNVDLAMALSIPLVALGTLLGVRHVRKVVTRAAR